MMNGGMMGNSMMADSGSLYGVEPISLDQAQKAVEDYVAGPATPTTVGSDDLRQPRLRLLSRRHRHGALEVLVDR
jgi:hypothetical protein